MPATASTTANSPTVPQINNPSAPLINSSTTPLKVIYAAGGTAGMNIQNTCGKNDIASIVTTDYRKIKGE